MEKILLGKTGMEISKVIYGGIVSMQDGQDNSDKYVQYAIDHGINYFDVAPTYGDAEQKLGNSLVPFRKDIYLACKTQQRKAEQGKQFLENSLNLLKTDYFDLYQMHELASVEEVESAFASDGIMNHLDSLKSAGVIKHLGITCHSEKAAIRALELYDFETVLFPTNWGLNIRNGYGDKLAEKISEKNIGFLGMKSYIERSWDAGEKENSTFKKSWCKPIDHSDTEFLTAAIRYAYNMGVHAIVPPGNFQSFSFAVENFDQITKPLTDSDTALLQKNFKNINNRYFFTIE